jgi:hypothetical protein
MHLHISSIILNCHFYLSSNEINYIRLNIMLRNCDISKQLILNIMLRNCDISRQLILNIMLRNCDI